MLEVAKAGSFTSPLRVLDQHAPKTDNINYVYDS